jgi:hypothetical protein
MSQNTGNNRNEAQGNSRPNAQEEKSRQKYEGFEGMNYEQPRQPYQHRSIDHSRERSGNEPGSSQSN